MNSEMNHMCIILLMTATGGIIGGITNFAFLPNSERSDKWYKDLPRTVISGLAASLVVPLFLFVIRSEIMEKSREDDLYYLAVLGFGVLAGVYSKRFLMLMGDEALNLARDAKSEASQANKKSDAIIETESEGGSDDKPETQAAKVDLDESEQAVMNEFPKADLKFRSLHGIAKDARMALGDLRKAFDSLITKGLLKEIETEKGKRFYLTNAGRKQLGLRSDQLSAGNEEGHGAGRPKNND